MPVTDLERLVIQLEAQSTKLDKALANIASNVDRKLAGVEKRTSVMSDRVNAAFGRAGAAIAGYLSARQVIVFIGRLTEAADKLQALSDRTGVGTDQLQKLAGAAAKANVDTGNLSDSLDVFVRNLGQAQAGQGDLAKVMRDLGVEAGPDLVTTLLDIADKVQLAKTRTEEYRITQAAFGKSSEDLVNFLRQGRDAIKAQMDAFNNGISPQAVKDLAEFNQHWQEISVSFTNMAAGPAAFVLKGLSDFLHTLEQGSWPQRLRALASFFSGGLIAQPLVTLEDQITDVGNRLDVATDKVMRMNAAIQQTPNFFTAEEITAAADEMVRLQKELAALVKQRPAPAAAPTAAKPFGGPPTEKVKTLTELLGEPTEGLARLQETLDKARKAEQDFVSNQYLLGKETRDRTAADIEGFHDKEVEDLKEHKAEMQAVIDDADQRAAEKRQQEMDDAVEDAQRLQQVLRTGVTDSLVDVGLAARHGFGALEDSANRALDRIIDLILEMNVLRPLLEGAGSAFNILGLLNFGGGASGVTGAGFSDLPVFAARGDIVGPQGRVPVHRYARGGVGRARNPQVAIFSEGSMNEAYVPLPDGRRIPVSLKVQAVDGGLGRGGQQAVVNITNQNSFAGAIDAKAMMRYADQVGVVSGTAAVEQIRKHFPVLMRKASRDAL